MIYFTKVVGRRKVSIHGKTKAVLLTVSPTRIGITSFHGCIICHGNGISNKSLFTYRCQNIQWKPHRTVSTSAYFSRCSDEKIKQLEIDLCCILVLVSFFAPKNKFSMKIGLLIECKLMDKKYHDDTLQWQRCVT